MFVWEGEGYLSGVGVHACVELALVEVCSFSGCGAVCVACHAVRKQVSDSVI